jgi:DNA-binding NtrC family response regulator
MATILYVDDGPSVGLMLEDMLRRTGHRPLRAQTVPEALELLARGDIDLVIADYRMPGLTGPEFLALLQREGYDTPLIMLTADASIEQAVASIRAGAADYITKPAPPQQLERAVAQVLELVRLRRENDALRRELTELRHGDTYSGAAVRAPDVGGYASNRGYGGYAHGAEPGAVTLTTLNVGEAEAVLIQHALAATGQNRTRAAEMLGISVRTLRNKLNGPAKHAAV